MRDSVGVIFKAKKLLCNKCKLTCNKILKAMSYEKLNGKSR